MYTRTFLFCLLKSEQRLWLKIFIILQRTDEDDPVQERLWQEHNRKFSLYIYICTNTYYSTAVISVCWHILTSYFASGKALASYAQFLLIKSSVRAGSSWYSKVWWCQSANLSLSKQWLPLSHCKHGNCSLTLLQDGLFWCWGAGKEKPNWHPSQTVTGYCSCLCMFWMLSPRRAGIGHSDICTLVHATLSKFTT